MIGPHRIDHSVIRFLRRGESLVGVSSLFAGAFPAIEVLPASGFTVFAQRSHPWDCGGIRAFRHWFLCLRFVEGDSHQIGVAPELGVL